MRAGRDQTERPEIHGEPRAAPPRPPAPTRELERQRAAQREYRMEREQVERRSLMRGLVLLALLALLVSMARAGLDRVFVHGWWRQW